MVVTVTRAPPNACPATVVVVATVPVLGGSVVVVAAPVVPGSDCVVLLPPLSPELHAVAAAARHIRAAASGERDLTTMRLTVPIGDSPGTCRLRIHCP